MVGMGQLSPPPLRVTQRSAPYLEGRTRAKCREHRIKVARRIRLDPPVSADFPKNYAAGWSSPLEHSIKGRASKIMSSVFES
jgi:hypothetical protein